MSVFSGHDLICVRGERLVFKNLSYSVQSGGALVLIGPNGTGKSSLLRMMASLLRPYHGHLAWDGQPVKEDPEAHRARTHYVGHHDAIKPVLTVEENLAFWAGLRTDNPDTRKTFEDALRIFDIAHLIDVPGRFLSAGQKRRVNLARVVAAPAPVWLLDEPTTALDKASIKALERLMDDHRKSGGMVILSTHQDVELDQPDVLDLAEFTPKIGEEGANILASGV